jgi:hypothetical protein
VAVGVGVKVEVAVGVAVRAAVRVAVGAAFGVALESLAALQLELPLRRGGLSTKGEGKGQARLRLLQVRW